MDQFENNTPVQGDTQGETSHNEPEQAPIQEAPVQETSARETSAQKNGQEKPHDDVFAEQSFAETQYRQTSNGYAQNGYAQSGYAQNGYAQNVQAQNAQQPFDPYQQGADMQYRSMYSNNGYVPHSPYAANQGQQGHAQAQQQYAQYAQQGGYVAYPTQGGGVPPVSDIPQKEMKKSSKAWLIIAIICLVALLATVMLLLAAGHKNDDKEIAGTPSGSGVTVNINVAPHPADDSLYADKETGLFTTAGAAEQVLPSIVNLYGYTDTSIAAYNEASGIIISEDGYIITNAHAVEDIKRFKAKLHDEREFEATVVGIDTRTDLAVLKIEADDLVPAVIGSSDDMKQGEQVVAIGNAGCFNDTVTVGYVSYVNREIQSYTNYPITCIQTDAALNFGNSGGALVNMYGQVVGIVVSKYSSTGSENIGFAIASDFAVPIAEDLIEKGYVSDRPRIGIMYSLITPEYAAQLDVKPGMLISEISPDCDVANTDLQKDDIITELNGKQILTAQDVKNFQNTAKAGDKVTAKVYRKTITGEVTEFEIEFTLEQDK